MVGHVPRRFTCQTVTHPSSNRARCRATRLVDTNVLPLHHAATIGTNFKTVRFPISIFSSGTDLIAYRYSSFCSSCWSDLFKKPKAPSFQIRSEWLAIDWIVGFSTWVTFLRWPPWCHLTQKSAAVWWVHMKRLPGAYAVASGSSWSIIHSDLF